MEHRLDSRYATRSLQWFSCFFLLDRVGCVVGRDAVDGAVFDPCPERFLVFLAPKRRVHFSKRAESLVIIGREEQVVWSDFTRDVDSILLRRTHEIDALLRREVCNVEVCTVFLCEVDRITDRLRFRLGRTIL